MSIVNKRYEHITLILKYWNQGDYSLALGTIKMMNDPSVIMDVFSTTFSEGRCIDSISLENVLNILPLSLILVESKYDPYIQVGIHTIQNLLGTFGEVSMRK
jgi:hypothetical protein